MKKDTGSVQSAGTSAWVYRGVAWALLSVALAIAAPYSLEMEFGFWQRLGYWTSVNLLAIGLATGIRHGMLRWFPVETLGVLLSIAVVQSLVLGFTVWTVNLHVFGFDLQGKVWLAELTLIMLLICLCVAMIRYEVARVRSFVTQEQGSLPAQQEDRVVPPRPAFLDRGETPLEGEVLVVSAADHYLDVVTTEGQGRVLMRFRDALSELEAFPGFRIHRSHWVATSELVRVRPEGRRHVADLRSGQALPVSDAYVDDLRRAGLLADDAIGKRIGTGPRTSMSASSAIRCASSGRSQNRPPV